MRKAQTEIIGLVIIVILIALGMLFALQFAIKKPSAGKTQAVKESTLAANFLNALLSTTTECNKRSIKELLQDCAVFGAINCGAESSCSYAHKAVSEIIDSTLGKWNKKYALTIKDGQELSQFAFEKGSCLGEKEAKVRPVPVGAGYQITLRLEICRE